MTDYTKNPSASSTMMIRDTGGTVEFWFKAGSSTFNHQQQWGYETDGGGWNMGQFDLTTGGAWHNVGSVYLGPGGDRQVGMRIVGAGLGWATTDLIVTVPRATVPPAPSWYDVHPESSSQIYAQFSGNGDGGSGVDIWEIGYGTDPNYPQYYYDSYAGHIGGLNNQYVWYFWGRGHNAVGWGPWSARIAAQPFDVPPAPTSPTFGTPTNVSVPVSFSSTGDGRTPVRQWQIAYGTDPTTPTNFVDYTVAAQVVAGLTENTTYYFWSRGRNDIGWSAYSARSSIRTQGTPDPPSAPVLSGATQTTMNTAFTLNADNGKPITGQQIGYGKNPDAPEAYVDVALNDILLNLEAGTLYYFWSRAKNVYGLGALSAKATARTVAGAWVNVNGVWKEAVPFVNVNGVWKLAQAWGKISGVWKGVQ